MEIQFSRNLLFGEIKDGIVTFFGESARVVFRYIPSRCWSAHWTEGGEFALMILEKDFDMVSPAAVANGFKFSLYIK